MERRTSVAKMTVRGRDTPSIESSFRRRLVSEYSTLDRVKTRVHLRGRLSPLLLVRRDNFPQPIGPIVYHPHVGRMTQVGVCFEGNSGLARLLGFFHSDPLKLFLAQLCI